MNFPKEKILQNVKIVVLAIFLSVGVGAVHGAWAPPPGSPTACPTNSPGCDAPLHLGNDGQIKQGGLTVGYSLDANQSSLLVLKGKVGIGTSEPTQMLDVVGYSKSRTGFCINDSCIQNWNVGGSAIPSGAIVAAFNLSSCPSGWSPYTDAVGRNIMGVGNSGTPYSTNHTLGQKGGFESVVQQHSQLPSHNHGVSGNYSSWVNTLGAQQKNFCTNESCGNSSYIITTGSFFSPTVDNNPGGSPMSIMDPYVTLLYCSKDLP